MKRKMFEVAGFNEGMLSLVEEERGVYDSNRDFTSLEAWEKARKVKLFFYKSILPTLPKEEAYRLGSQIRSAGVSSTANIAEGYGRYHFQEGIQFYRIARGSIYELKDHLITCFDLGYVDDSTFDEGINLIEESKITLNGFIRFVINQNKSVKKK